MARIGQKWPISAKSGRYRTKVANTGQKWPIPAKRGQKWPVIARIFCFRSTCSMICNLFIVWFFVCSIVGNHHTFWLKAGIVILASRVFLFLRDSGDFWLKSRGGYFRHMFFLFLCDSGDFFARLFCIVVRDVQRVCRDDFLQCCP